MTGEEEPLDSHTIELADTRPIMWRIPFLGFLGEVPMNAGLILWVLAGWGYSFGGIKYFIWLPFAWFLISRLLVDNPHGLTHAQRWFETGMPFCLDRKSQGGVSATPFPQIEGKKRGMV